MKSCSATPVSWLPVEAGIYRLNKVKSPNSVQVACSQRDESEVPQTFVDYEDQPREYFLNAVTTILDEHTRVSDLYSSPHDQIKEQLRLTIETIKERQESELIWFDNAATTHKPKSVIEGISYFYEHENSNIHRGAHELAARATDAYEAAREKVRQFINASPTNELVFVRGTTEAINLVAKSWGAQTQSRGDEIVISWLEHQANIVPWQQLAAEKGLVLKVIPVDDRGQTLLDEYARLLGPKVKLVSFIQVSNALGTVTPAQQMVAMAHAVGAKVLVGDALSKEGIAVRTGHHCAQPILRRFGLEATVRPSLAFYNTCEEIDVAVVRRLATTRK